MDNGELTGLNRVCKWARFRRWKTFYGPLHFQIWHHTRPVTNRASPWHSQRVPHPTCDKPRQPVHKPRQPVALAASATLVGLPWEAPGRVPPGTRSECRPCAAPLPLFCPAIKNEQPAGPAGSHSRVVTAVQAPEKRNRPVRPRILGRMCNSAEIHTKKCHLFTPRPPPLANFWTNFGRLCFKSPTRTLRPVKATNSDLGDDSFCRFVV